MEEKKPVAKKEVLDALDEAIFKEEREVNKGKPTYSSTLLAKIEAKVTALKKAKEIISQCYWKSCEEGEG